MLLVFLFLFPFLNTLSISNRKNPAQRFYSVKSYKNGFCISYTHSVNKGRVHDYYVFDKNTSELIMTRTHFVSYGAGIPEPEETEGADFEVLENGYIINNINTLSTTRTREEFDFYGFFKDLGADDQSLKDWKEVRRKKGGINTKSAADAIIKEINKSGKTVRECIAKSASSSWCGFKWAWWQREMDEESGNNVRRNENQRVNDRRRGTPPSHPKTAEEWGFGDRQKKM